jgi:UTP--glucose-1-phosphate uridylyltransferase
MTNTSPSRIHKVVIPAAGLGKRLRPATLSQPKEMLPVGRKPTIQYVVEEAVQCGLSSILIVTGRHKRAIEDHFDREEEELNGDIGEDEVDFEQLGVSFFFVRQSHARGLADAISRAEEFASDDPFVVSLGDTIIYSPDEEDPLLRRLIHTHLSTGASVTVAVEPVAREDVVKYGIVQPRTTEAESFELSGLIEKPTPSEAPSQLAIASRYVFNPEIFDAIRAIKAVPPGYGGEYQITDAIRWLIREGHAVWAVQLAPAEIRYDIGNFATYFRAFVELSLQDGELGADLSRHLRRLLATRC